MLPNLKIGNLTAKYPIIQGGMGVGISLSSLAGAVAKAGGIGIISAAQPGWRDPEFARDPLSANLQGNHAKSSSHIDGRHRPAHAIPSPWHPNQAGKSTCSL